MSDAKVIGVRSGAWDIGAVASRWRALGSLVPLACRARVESILGAHGTSIKDWFAPIDAAIERLPAPPWAIVLFDRQVPLMDYLTLTRGRFEDYAGLSYEAQAKGEAAPGGAPLAGVLIRTKECLSSLYPGDEPYDAVWSLVGGLDESRRWFCLLEMPDFIPAADAEPRSIAAYREARAGIEAERKPGWLGKEYGGLLARILEEELRVERRDAIMEPSGFFWWPAERRQEISIPARVKYREDEAAWILSVATDLARGVRRLPGLLPALASVAERGSSGSACVYEQLDGSLKLVTRLLVAKSDLPWAARMISLYAGLQAADAEELAPGLVARFGGSDWKSRHPWSGPRKAPHPSLLFRETRVLPAGGEPWLWLDEEDRAAVRRRYAGAEPSILEAPSCMLVPRTTMADVPGALELYPSHHPLLGNGLGINLRLPMEEPFHLMVETGVGLNLALAESFLISLVPGAWTALPMPGLRGRPDYDECLRRPGSASPATPAFRLFLPNCLHESGLLEQLLERLDLMPAQAWSILE